MTIKTDYKSIMPLDMKGVGYGVGLSGVGKSYMFGRAENPNLTCYLDFDDGKGEQLHAKYHYGMYRDVKAEIAAKFGDTSNSGKFYKPKHVFAFLDELFNSIKQDRFTYCFIDNLSPLEKALAVEIKSDPDGYGIGRNSKTGISNAVTGAFGGANPGIQDLVSNVVNILHGKIGRASCRE